MHTETIATPANADVQTAPKMKMITDIPGAITTPDRVETRLGTLKFFDGLPRDSHFSHSPDCCWYLKQHREI